jgi:hypothetical protein
MSTPQNQLPGQAPVADPAQAANPAPAAPAAPATPPAQAAGIPAATPAAPAAPTAPQAGTQVTDVADAAKSSVNAANAEAASQPRQTQSEIEDAKAKAEAQKLKEAKRARWPRKTALYLGAGCQPRSWALWTREAAAALLPADTPAEQIEHQTDCNVGSSALAQRRALCDDATRKPAKTTNIRFDRGSAKDHGELMRSMHAGPRLRRCSKLQGKTGI